jgi:single-strand DNA-binding protein
MAMSLNRAQLIGNVTRDPEVRQIPGGTNVASFSIATNFVWKDASGQKQEKAEFHNIVAWRNLADICSQFLHKGGKVYVEGRIQTRDWEGEDGVKRYRTEIVADNIILLDKKGAGEGMSYTGSQSEHGGIERQKRESTGDAQVVEGEVAMEDLPF